VESAFPAIRKNANERKTIAAERRATVGNLSLEVPALHICFMTIALDSAEAAPPAPRLKWPAFSRGIACRCPACGRGPLFSSYIKVADRCPVCGEELHHHRADDAPPYFTIFIVAHIVVPLVLIVERIWQPSLFIHMAIWIPVTLALTLLLLPVVKGAIVALQWALRMHGFEYSAAAQSALRPLDS